MKIEIKHRSSQSTLFSHDVEQNTLKITLAAAIKAGVDLGGVDLSGVDLSDVDLGDVNLYRAKFCGANLCSANLVEAILRHSIWRNADLSGANLRGADLSYANLSGSILSNTYMDGANLYGTNFCGAILDGEVLTQNPISISCLNWPVLISDGFMRIGCQRHSHQEWASFDNAQISNMASEALKFWRQWKQPLLAMCSAHAGKIVSKEVG